MLYGGCVNVFYFISCMLISCQIAAVLFVHGQLPVFVQNRSRIYLKLVVYDL